MFMRTENAGRRRLKILSSQNRELATLMRMGIAQKKKIDENAEFPTFGVPKGATRVGELEYLGSKLPNLGVLVEHYTGTDENKDYFYVMAPTSISDGRQCVPVMTSELTVSPLTERLVELV